MLIYEISETIPFVQPEKSRFYPHGMFLMCFMKFG